MSTAKVTEALQEGQKVHEILQGIQKTPTAVNAAQGEKGSLGCGASAFSLPITDLVGH